MYPVKGGIPRHLFDRLIWLSDSARLNGIHVMGGSGSGKSRLAGRAICWMDFLRGVPLVLIEPTGGTWANMASKIYRLPPAQQKQCWKRILYVDMSGSGDSVVPFPLLFRLREDESLFTTGQRYLEVVRRLDPALAQASVEGMNALSRVWTYASMVVIALGYQVTEISRLIRDPEGWKERLNHALQICPDVRPAVEFFYDFMAWSPEQRARRTDALLIKLMPFEVDPSMTAMFGASTPGIDWEDAITAGKTVILDFSREKNAERLRFKLMWVFLTFVEYLEQRGLAGRKRPVSFVIDEVTQLLGNNSAQTSMLADDFEKLVSVIARNYGVWLTIAHQSLTQIEERIRNVLMQMGTQVIGVMPNPEDALYLAQQFTLYDPYWMKKKEPIWMSVTDPLIDPLISTPKVIDWRYVEFSADEQLLLAADEFRSLPRFRFLVRTAKGEGDIANRLRRMSIARLDVNQFPDMALVSEVERRLMARSGIPVSQIFREIEGRLQGEPIQKSSPVPAATIKRNAHYLPTHTSQEDEDEEIFREDA